MGSLIGSWKGRDSCWLWVDTALGVGPAPSRPAPQECRSVMARAVPDASVARMMLLAFGYLADAIMLQLMSGERMAPAGLHV